MSRLAIISCAILVCISTTTVVAQESGRRSLTSCMSRRMATDRMISYNEAQKMCREQLKSPGSKPETAANSAPKPVG